MLKQNYNKKETIYNKDGQNYNRKELGHSDDRIDEQEEQIVERRNLFGDADCRGSSGKSSTENLAAEKLIVEKMTVGESAEQTINPEKNQLVIRLKDGEIMYVNVDEDGWVEIRFSDSMKKVIKANADYFASYYR